MGRNRPASLLAPLLGFVFPAFWIWSIGWTFYRHDRGDGLLALTIPPYAWYRGLAAIWEEPKWKEHWAVRTENLGILLHSAGANPPPSEQMKITESKAKAKEWISALPNAERQRLLSAATAYCTGMNQVRRNLIEDNFKALKGRAANVSFRAPSDSSVTVSSAQLESYPGLMAAWRRMEQETETDQKLGIEAFVKLQEELARSGKTLDPDAVDDRFRGIVSRLRDEDLRTRAMLSELFDSRP